MLSIHPTARTTPTIRLGIAHSDDPRSGPGPEFSDYKAQTVTAASRNRWRLIGAWNAFGVRWQTAWERSLGQSSTFR